MNDSGLSPNPSAHSDGENRRLLQCNHLPIGIAPPRRGADRSAEIQSEFLALADRVAGCRLCPSMEGRRRVLGELNGPLDAIVLFIAEAPGRFGADRTGIPLSNDRSGRNFERLLACARLSRCQVFVTNVVLCNPRDGRGRNRPPSPAELANCTAHLRSQLALVDAPVVVTLGRTALRALDQIEPHGLTLRDNAGQSISWRGRLLVPLYHPSGQAMLHRPFACQEDDYRALGRLVQEICPSTS